MKYTLKDLSKAVSGKGFWIGGYGISGAIDDRQVCLAAVYHLDGAEEKFLKLCSSAKDQSNRLNGLLGLRLLNSTHFQEQYEKIRTVEEKIFTFRGCIGCYVTVASLADEIAQGRGDFLRTYHRDLCKREEEFALKQKERKERNERPEISLRSSYNPLYQYAVVSDVSDRIQGIIPQSNDSFWKNIEKKLI